MSFKQFIQRNKRDLADQFQKKCNQLNAFAFDGNLDSMSQSEQQQSLAIVKEIQELEKPLKSLIDRSTEDLKNIGMKDDLENKVFTSQDDFEKAIKKAYPLDMGEGDPDQESLGRISVFLKEMEKLQLTDHNQAETIKFQLKLMDNLIELRTRYRKIVVACNNNKAFELVSNLENVPFHIRGMDNQNHLMSVKEFQSATSVFGRKRPEYLKKIDNLLRELEPPSTSRFAFLGKKKISADSQAKSLKELRELIRDIPEQAKTKISSEDQKIIGGLRLQVEYALCKEKSKNQPERAPVQAPQIKN
jgi:hypothetical protein